MQSTAAAPANFTLLYRRMIEEAVLAEDLGFHSIWLGEHRFWYDGWCPAPLVAASAIAAATERIRIGTAMLLLPQHHPEQVARTTLDLHRRARGRFELGIGLGYRDEEFDGLGIARSARGERMTAGLDRMLRAWGDIAAPRVWVGGMADRALDRGARRGLSFLLPPTLRLDETAAVVERIKDAAAAVGATPGRIGIVKDAWVAERGDDARSFFLPRLAAAYREYGAWWLLKGRFTGLERPDLLQGQVDRALDAAIVGDPDDVTAAIDALGLAGVDLVSLHLHRDSTRGSAWEQAVRLVADEVLPNVGRALEMERAR